VFWKGNPTKCKLQLDPILVKSPKNLQKQHEENSRMYPLTENVIGNNRHRRSASAARAPTRFHSFYQERGLSRTMELEMNKTLRDTLQDRTFEYQTILYWTVNSKLNLHSIFFVHFRWKNQSTTQTKNWNGIICMVRKSNKFSLSGSPAPIRPSRGLIWSIKTGDVPILTLHTLLGAKLRVGDEIKNFWSSHVLNSREGEKICRFESILTNNSRSNGAKYHWSWIPEFVRMSANRTLYIGICARFRV
jgi:hypothetical protein